MELFEVYNRFEMEPVRGQGCYLWDNQGNKYLDMYGGHAVISIGHNHPHYLERIQNQLQQIGFYSNSVYNSLQTELARKLGEISGYPEYQLFLCNSGAEANENALKLASFFTERDKVITLRGAFHGRTSAAVEMTDNLSIQSLINQNSHAIRINLNDTTSLKKAFQDFDICAVIIEGIQGIAGIHLPEKSFLQNIRELCDRNQALMILDEIQSGYGRTGKFFAHQHSAIQPDIITIAKGMGNGFPVAGVMIHSKIRSRPGMLGSTFGGNHLACAAALGVLEIIESESLVANAAEIGRYLLENLTGIAPSVKEVRGIGLMIGIELDTPVRELRQQLLHHQHIFTGSSANPNVLRILPPLTLKRSDADNFLWGLKVQLNG